MKISTTIGFNGDPKKLAQQARDLESAGVDLIWGAEIYGYDLISTLGYLAGQTSTVQLMTGIIPLYSRSPALIAQTAATLDALSDGRFVLGLGTSGPQVIEGWHGVPFAKPVRRTRETIEILRMVTGGERLTYDGDIYRLPLPGGQGKALRTAAPPVNVPVYVASLGPANLRLTGAAITQDHIDAFFRFYISTIDRKWGGAYLTHEVFTQLGKTMADRMLLVMAEYEGKIIGGALNFIGDDALYGRNWGADIDIPNLHFEACYYQAIDFAIEHGLSRVEAGAQGFHKVQRGYLPVTTHSVHLIAHDGFRDAVARFLDAEKRGVEAEKNHITMTSPFKAS